MANKTYDANSRKLNKIIFKRLTAIHNLIKSGCYPNLTRIINYIIDTTGENVSQATVYRDLATLRDNFHAEIKFDKTRDGYYYEREWEFELQSISPEEAFTLATAKTLLSNLSDTPIYKDICEVIDFVTDTQMPGNSALLGRIDVAPRPKKKIDEEIWKTIVTALTENRVLNLQMAYYGEPTPYKIPMKFCPYQFIFDEDRYALFGKELWYEDDKENPEILIYFDDIDSVELANESFKLPENYSYKDKLSGSNFGADQFFSSPMEEYKIKLFLNARNDIKNCSFAEDQKTIEENSEEGSVTVSFTSSQIGNVLGWIMEHGADAVPLSPQSLVDAWENEIYNLIEKSGVYCDWLSLNRKKAVEILNNRKNFLQERIDQRKKTKKENPEQSYLNQIYDYIARLIRTRKHLTFEYMKTMSSRDMMNFTNELLPTISKADFFIVAKKVGVLGEDNKIDISTAKKIVEFVRKHL